MSFIDLDGCVHFYRLEGRGSPVGTISDHGDAAGARRDVDSLPIVLVNALGTDQRIWDGFVAALPPPLAERATVLRYDLRGQGASELGAEPCRVERFGEELERLLARLALGPAVVVGLSLGGLVAQALASSAPERVRALALCATGLSVGAPELWRERAALVRARGLAAYSDAILERWFSAGFREREPELVRGHRTLLERGSLEGYLGSLEALEHADLTSRASAVRAPALVVAGESDLATPPARVQALARALPDARYVSLPGVGHLLPVEAPRPLADALHAFLREVNVV